VGFEPTIKVFQWKTARPLWSAKRNLVVNNCYEKLINTRFFDLIPEGKGRPISKSNLAATASQRNAYVFTIQLHERA
jgi:hypothetical protein